MATRLKEIFTKKRYQMVLDNIMPGGVRWEKIGEGQCLDDCPYYSRCQGNGPSGGKVCSSDWGEATTREDTWTVLQHVINNFDYYNLGDLNKGSVSRIVNELSGILDLPFDQSLGATEALALVKIRILQAEFKKNLFEYWDGCSINVNISDRFLVASHILPWSKSNDKDRLSKYNGFLLPSNYDYLFDRHLISFTEEGEIMRENTELAVQQLYHALGIGKNIRLNEGIYDKSSCAKYLDKHRSIYRAKFVRSC